MKHRTRTWSKVLALPLALTAWACSDSSTPTDLMDIPVANSVSVNFQAGNGDQFLFLPPLAPGNPSAALATGLDLTVTICDGAASCETLAAKEEDDHYQVNWKSDKAQGGVEYSVTVTGSDVPLGSLSITLENTGKDKAGSTFPIKFWVGETLGEAVAAVADCLGDDRCNAAYVPPSPTASTTIVTQDTNPDLGPVDVAQVTFLPESVPAGGLIVTVDCRQGTYPPGQGPLPTDLDQWPMFCHVDVRNPDGTQFTGSLPPGLPATVEVCVVDEDYQASYHPPVAHEDLVLGKSHTGSDFEFLPVTMSTLDCVGSITQTASASPVGRVLDAIGSRLAWALSPVLPQKLYARAMMFRDGGVGGLVSSFSDINPVQPAIIEGTVTYGAGGSGIAGITVTLGGEASAEATTDANGEYSFFPLQAAVGGSAYTVTVSGAPTFATPTQNVSVTGSGTFTADFQAELPAGFFYNPDNGSYYQAPATELSWADANAAAEVMTLGVCVGHLATVTSAQENAFIVSNMPLAIAGNGTLGGGYWIGAHQPLGGDPDYPSGPTNPWEWVTGEPFGSYTNWGPGEPNNLGNAENTVQFYGDWNPSYPSTWNDEPGDRAYGYVVEYQCGS